ncbi:Acyl-CoA synthetase (AMP-forming)/AMP-acid ligase II [Micromonospora sediminicola]|uniref:Acyl-CoA synthetase (AMP-forming)/AMP-acid ligase II n=1 Tax=Micromonospora sediminicola TaxID=946078 RepID=A0A1A9B837_9ACTN|nr:AMP-binding protein [Micromonospora sediminicola]SBT65695.1 Acyl-CoA synthetase (AMP-forming)/AMP-acid ligase II [Micromonospora sediminicola]
MADQALGDVLLDRAERTPDEVAYELAEPSGRVTTMSYAQLASRASVLARQLAAGGDGPVLLAYPAGLDYVVAVFAAFLAGRPVIPAYPPGPSSLPDRARLSGIVQDAHPSTVVAAQHHAELAVPTVLAVPGAEADGSVAPPRCAADSDVAIIQYTSGSTGQPKGVLVRHDSVVANTAAIADRFGLDVTSRGLTWLPPFHDMGLVGGLLTPMAAGIPVRILQPGDFLKAPLWWLRQITESGATASGGPNFAYDLCVRRVRSADELAGLDLSGWRVAFSGGESVKHQTMAGFARTFASTGFRPEAFLPCFGLAEATLMVSAGHWSPTAAADTAVSCGRPVPGQRVTIVDPERLTPVPDGDEGEIWVGGPHITPGYLSGESGDLFGELDGTRLLRTGDLGYLREGELFLTGRMKDVIVFRGANFHAGDIESAGLEAVGRQAGAAAAFLVDEGPEPLPVLVVEVRGRPDEKLAAGVRAAVLARTRLPLSLVVLAPPRSVPRTSSGKVRRSACREVLLAGGLDAAVVSDRPRLAALSELRDRERVTGDLAAVVCGILAAVCGVGRCRPTDDLAGLGMDSVQAAEAAAVLEDAVGLTVPLETLLGAATPRDIADTLLARWLADDCTPTLVRDRLALIGEGAGVG